MRQKRARSFVFIIILIAISALILRSIIERVVKADLAQNEANASTTLKLISAALQNYAKDNRGAFPESISSLLQSNPSYLDKDYVADSPLNGYIYTYSKLAADGYSCSAMPAKCNLSGKFTYSVSTGGVFSSEECSKKENEIAK